MDNNQAKIDIVYLGVTTDRHTWELGKIYQIQPSPQHLAKLIDDELQHTQADAWLLWDTSLGVPNVETIVATYQKPANVWHAGLKLGMQNQPHVIDFSAPTDMFTADPSPEIESSSWRLSWRCCLIEVEVLRQMGNVSTRFQSLDAAMLDLGYRYIKYGVITRHIPSMLLAEQAISPKVTISFHDEILFLQRHF